MNKLANPQMLLLARESRGITQTELSRSLDVTQAAISKAEKIFGKVSDELLQKIADKLKYPIDFFYQQKSIYPPMTPLQRKNSHWGKKAGSS